MVRLVARDRRPFLNDLFHKSQQYGLGLGGKDAHGRRKRTLTGRWRFGCRRFRPPGLVERLDELFARLKTLLGVSLQSFDDGAPIRSGELIHADGTALGRL